MLSAMASIAAGAASWSFAEWMVHYHLGHRLAKNRNFFAVEHVRHHATTSYFAPSWKKGAAAALVSAAVMPVAAALIGRKLGAAYTIGFAGTYLGYELLHRWAHVRPPTTGYGRWARKHHFHHHFHAPSKNHGVTSPMWDHVFGSYEPPTKVRVPARHAMPWLIDPKSGDVWPAYRDDYELIAKNPAKPARSDEPKPAHAA
jgi:sterol desaturase/sphingolipid hydroxylase (fatty acid hydroxylase superfamily)